MTALRASQLAGRTLPIVTAVVLLGVAVATPIGGALSATDGKIVFTSERDGNAEIYVVKPDGSGSTRLTRNKAGDASASWSPDRTRIAFDRVPSLGGGYDVYVMNARGRG